MIRYRAQFSLCGRPHIPVGGWHSDIEKARADLDRAKKPYRTYRVDGYIEEQEYTPPEHPPPD